MPLPQPPDPATTLLLDGRLPALLTGIVLLGWGAKVYRLLVLAPGILAGVYVGAVLRELLHLDGTGTLVATVVLAGAGALVCHFVEGVALRVGGAGLFAALGWFVWPLVRHGAVPWWLPLATAVVGALAFPWLYRVMLRPVTAIVGAFTVAWAVKRPDTLWLIAALAVTGTAIQYWLDRGGGGGGSAKPAKKKGK